jgi:hypothetical protein
MLDRPDEPSIGPQSDLIPPRFLDRPLTPESDDGPTFEVHLHEHAGDFRIEPTTLGSSFDRNALKLFVKKSEDYGVSVTVKTNGLVTFD